ncbi:MAG: nucleotidyltransferase domain-containing protein, partial [Rhodospirillales bacterium]|nr:nucleotidyltransferase domain-containing protein [Rhodospirillales bacterium]
MLPPAPLPESPQDVAALLRQSLAAASEAVAGPLPRDAALGVFRRHLARIQTHVRDTFELGNLPGLKAARMLAGLTDGLIAELFDHAVASVGGTAGGGLWGLGRSGRLAIAATGGYGRGVLAPFSDIDLLFLTDGRPTAQVQRVVEFMLYFLWDLGLKVGHATRSKADCLTEARGDHTVRTS